MKIQLGTLKHRDSWGDEDDDDSAITVGTLEIGGQKERRRRKRQQNQRITLRKVRQDDTRSVRFIWWKGRWRLVRSSSNDDVCWVELDIKEKSLKWYQGDDNSGKIKGDVRSVRARARKFHFYFQL